LWRRCVAQSDFTATAGAGAHLHQRLPAGELLDRLSDELAMVTIDLTNLDIQESRIRDQLESYDPATLDEKRLEELMKQDPYLVGSDQRQSSPLSSQLLRRGEQLRRERFCLVVTDVSPQEQAAR
jgi:hypothetical protein